LKGQSLDVLALKVEIVLTDFDTEGDTALPFQQFVDPTLDLAVGVAAPAQVPPRSIKHTSNKT
jgi:hypothetical protein